MNKQDGGPAFGQVVELKCVRVDPFGGEEYEPETCLHGGLTVRDYFAAKAMQSYLMHSSDTEQNALHAYEQADAMLKARQGEA
ncbi:hypothetical protein [Pseudomonas nitroreducens]|uniref:hypothetical protein n=1 Tax=Pseudomonas nitroreducens TaxID=46680 RepID=UPI003CC821B6